MMWTKGTHQSAKFRTFDCSREISPNLYFDRILLLKVYKISAKKSMEELCPITLKNNAKFEEKLICCSKNLIWALKILKISVLIDSFCAKYITFDLKKYKGDMQLISKFNRGFRFLLYVIDIYSKYAWVFPLKDKKRITITNACQKC